MGSTAVKRTNVPQKVRTAIVYMLEQKADMQAAALAAGLSTYELRRYLGKPQVRQFALEAKKAALEALCLTGPGTLAEVLKGENEMAKCKAVQIAESLRMDTIELEQRATQRAPGLQIVIALRDGKHEVAYQPTPAMLEVEVVPAEPVPVPAQRPDAEAE